LNSKGFSVIHNYETALFLSISASYFIKCFFIFTLRFELSCPLRRVSCKKPEGSHYVNKFFALYEKRNFNYRLSNSLPLHHILSHMNPNYTHRFLNIHSNNIQTYVLKAFSSAVPFNKYLYIHVYSLFTCCMPCQFRYCYYDGNTVWRKVQMMQHRVDAA
jgi:hypothetical protein